MGEVHDFYSDDENGDVPMFQNDPDDRDTRVKTRFGRLSDQEREFSLTGALEEKGHPLRQFFESWFPNRSAISADVRAFTRDCVTLKPRARVAWSTVGMAIDHRIRLYLAEPEPRAAASGAASIARAEIVKPSVIETFFADLIDFCAGYDVAGRRLDEEAEDRLCRYCYALALMEEVFRAGPHPNSPIFELSPRSTPDDVLALASDVAVDDLRQLSWLFFDSQQGLMSQKLRASNPTFAGSTCLAGADGDLIIDRCLIDIKALVDPKKFSKPSWPWQLLGYALLDFPDEYEIRELGIYFARQGLLLEWAVDEFAEKLAGTKQGVSEARKALEDLLRR